MEGVGCGGFACRLPGRRLAGVPPRIVAPHARGVGHGRDGEARVHGVGGGRVDARCLAAVLLAGSELRVGGEGLGFRFKEKGSGLSVQVEWFKFLGFITSACLRRQ